MLIWLSAALDPDWPARPHIATIEPEKLLLEVTPSEVVGKPIAHYGVYEYAVTRLLRSYLQPGDVFVDVGANIGYYSTIAANIVGGSGRVFAFEPSDRIRARLLRNVALNEFTQVEVRSEAVSNRSGTVNLVEPESGKNDGLAFVDRSGSTGVSVAAIRLDDLPELAQRVPALLKVDVEGGEPEVFAGAKSLLTRRDAPSILFESFEIERDAALLRGAGYQLFQPTLCEGTLGLTSNLTAPRYRRWEAPNYLAAKSERGLRFAQELARSK